MPRPMHLPFDDRSFDNVTCFDVLEHLTEEDLPKALGEMARVAKRTVTVSASERPSIFKGRDLHISKRPKAKWIELFKSVWGQVQVIGNAGASPAFRLIKHG